MKLRDEALATRDGERSLVTSELLRRALTEPLWSVSKVEESLVESIALRASLDALYSS